ncbi:MAG: flippase [Bacilli bacterium]|nr:flippase [Bacilli bacterium]
MKKNVKANYVYNLLYQLLTIILPIITIPYLARTLGSEGNGIYGYTLSIATYFTLIGSLGIALYGQREIAYCQDNRIKRSKVFWELNIIKFITMIISIIVFYFVYARSGEYAIYYKILLLELFASIIDISWFYQGMEEFKTIVLRNYIIRMICLFCIFIFIKTPSDTWKYVLIFSGSTLLGNLSLWINLSKKISLIAIKKLNIKKHIKPILLLFIPQIAIQLYTVLDKSMIGMITNNMSEVAYYDQAQKVIKTLMTVITSISTVMLPRIAACYANNDKKRIKEYMNNSFKFIFMVSFPMIFGIIAVSDSFVPFFFGNGYDKIKIVMPLLSVIILFISMSIMIAQLLLSTKQTKKYTISVVSGAIINFVLNLILIYYFKSIGACIATIIAEFSIAAIDLYFIRSKFNIFEIIKSSKNYFLLSIVMFFVIYPFGYLQFSNMLTMVIQISIGGILYIIGLFIIKDEFFIDLYNNVINYIKNKLKISSN